MVETIQWVAVSIRIILISPASGRQEERICSILEAPPGVDYKATRKDCCVLVAG
jgi:hypothetical protein